jgi:hypothetical protein
MVAIGQRKQPGEAMHATAVLKVLLTASSAQRPAPPCLTICAGAVYTL